MHHGKGHELGEGHRGVSYEVVHAALGCVQRCPPLEVLPACYRSKVVLCCHFVGGLSSVIVVVGMLDGVVAVYEIYPQCSVDDVGSPLLLPATTTQRNEGHLKSERDGANAQISRTERGEQLLS